MSYQALELDGNGYAGIAHASQSGLNLGLSDFIVKATIKTTNTGSNRRMVSKYSATDVGWKIYMDSSGKLAAFLVDGTNDARVISTPTINDGRLHDVVWVVDRSSATGSKLFIDGSEVAYDTQEDPTGVLTLDNVVAVNVGSYKNGQQNWVGLLDEVEVWNFGYGGLPADYAAYITWRAAGRNVFLDISEYNGGAWNGYADADRTELVTDGGLENWTTDTNLTSWTESEASAGVRDITKESTEKHGGNFATKLEATLSDGTSFNIDQPVNLVTRNKYYELTGWSYFASRTEGVMYLLLYNEPDDIVCNINSSTIEGAYTFHAAVGMPTVDGAGVNRVYAYIASETTTGIVYFDDISLKRVGLVGHWKFNGNYNDETTNANHLTAGGTGNVFPGYSLRTKAQKMLLGVG